MDFLHLLRSDLRDRTTLQVAAYKLFVQFLRHRVHAWALHQVVSSRRIVVYTLVDRHPKVPKLVPDHSYGLLVDLDQLRDSLQTLPVSSIFLESLRLVGLKAALDSRILCGYVGRLQNRRFSNVV